MYIYTTNITPELISGNINYLLNQKDFFKILSFYLISP